MLPRKLHIAEINRFHDKMKELQGKIDIEKDKDVQYALLKKWYELQNFWSEIDDFIESKVRDIIDRIENE